MQNSFFAAISRMKYIVRWALMRSARPENISEHSGEVAVIAHALAVIGSTRYGRKISPERAAIIGLYHDAPEIITGDMPTPVKYGSEEIREAYHTVEEKAARRLLSGLPEDLRPAYESILLERPESDEDRYLLRLVKAADKMSALIKCIEEEKAGNTEFVTAAASTRESLDSMAEEMPEVRDSMRDFLPSYGRTLDELLKGDQE